MSAVIHWHEEAGEWLSPTNELALWLQSIASGEGKRIVQLDFRLMDDKSLWELNKKFLSHDTLTDIITFDHSRGKQLRGELCLSFERIRQNASELGIEEEVEQRRVMVHGLLHLCGYKDKTDAEKRKMRRMEDRALNEWKNVSRGT